MQKLFEVWYTDNENMKYARYTLYAKSASDALSIIARDYGYDRSKLNVTG